jgi:hypothetical protein
MQKKLDNENKKEKEDKQTKWVAELGFVVDWVIWKTNEKHVKTQLGVQQL